MQLRLSNTFRLRISLTHLFLIVCAVIMLYPLLWMVSSSLKPESIIFREKGIIPTAVTLDNYLHGWNALGVPFTRFSLTRSSSPAALSLATS